MQVLCLSPTYELALQTGDVAGRMSHFAPELTIRYAVRGENVPRGSSLKDHIIIGTPGKVLFFFVYHYLGIYIQSRLTCSNVGSRLVNKIQLF